MIKKTKIGVYIAVESVIGRRLAHRVYREICVRRLRRAGCIFVHIPKAAGTSVAEATVGQRTGHFTAAELKSVMGDAEFGSLFSFAITRHPLDRLVSAYNYARRGGGSHGAIRPNRAYASRRFRSFDAFVNEWLVEQNLEEVDRVFRPQTQFIFGGGICLVDYVARVEGLREAEVRLSEELGRPIRIPQKNRGDASRGQQKIAASPITQRAVYWLYKEDFERFGYRNDGRAIGRDVE